jgi:hypothetical protein
MHDASNIIDPDVVRLGAAAGERELCLGACIRGVGHRLATVLEPLEAPEFQRQLQFLWAMSADEEPEGEEGTGVLARLVDAWQLDTRDVDLLALAVMPHEHEGYASVLQSLHPRAEPRPSVGLAAQLFAGGRGERASLRRRLEHGPLARAGLVQVADDGPFFNASLVPGPGVATVLRGSSSWPRAVKVELEEPADVDLGGFARWLEYPACRRAVAALREALAVEIVVLAEDPATASQRARVLLAAARRPALVLELRGDPPAELATQIAIYASALGRVPVLSSPASERGWPELSTLLGPTLRCTTREHLGLGGRRAVIAVECERLDPGSSRQVWAKALPGFASQAAALAARFPLEPALIHAVAADLDAAAGLGGREPGRRELLDAIRLRAGAALRPGVRLRRPRAGWDRLILPGERLAALREALARVRHQARVIDDWGFLDDRPGARGVRILFCGPPGTGKTLAAEVLARELDTDLLIVDLSRLVSKWIGETEKNLAEVFASAERSRAVLLFDEADALFGKRTEISDAHDRYANLETAYLLTRLEQYEGLTVLATNLRRNVDAAFMRRLEFVVEFEAPSRSERLALWQVHLPRAELLAEDVDLRELADFYALSGGLIRNAAVAAAFLAADEDSRITRAQLLRAIRREYEKTGAAFPGTPPTRDRP